MDDMSIIVCLMLWSFISTILLVVLFRKIPYAWTYLTAKRLVFVVEADGTMYPVKAVLDNQMYKTERHGLFEFRKGAILSYGRRRTILVYSPISTALEVDSLAVLRRLHGNGVYTYAKLMELLDSKVESRKEKEEART